MSSTCDCGSIRHLQTAGPNSKFPGRQFYSCRDCNKFEWAGARRRLFQDDPAAPPCRCGKAAVERQVKKSGASNPPGTKFWSCATWPKGCGFFQVKDQQQGGAVKLSPQGGAASVSSSASPTSVASKKRPALPGFASYMPDWNQVKHLKEVINAGVDPKKLRKGSPFDGFEVAGAWKITNPTRWERYQQATQERHPTSVRLPSEFESAMNALGRQQLKTGEVFLLHGTSPENMHSILFQGLDPQVARNGKFGRGVYFAENIVKIDQYARTDARFEKSEGSLNDLHRELYKSIPHPKQVRYCLIARVYLGRHVTTKDGKTQLDGGSPLFLDERRSQLAPMQDGTNAHSLLAETGGLAKEFREFIVFRPEQIFIEYVVAYRGVRRLCDCGLPVVQRTVVKDTPNRGREVHFCSKDDDIKCAFIQMFPLCHCQLSAAILVSHSAQNPNRKYYACYYKQKQSYYNSRFRHDTCDFFEWCDFGYESSSARADAKRARYV